MNFLVMRYGNIVGQNLSKTEAVKLALHHNGIRHKIEHNGNGTHVLWLSLPPSDPWYKTLISSNGKTPNHVSEEIFDKLYKKRQTFDLQIYTPQEYELYYRTLIF